jgi:hypothetical protein
MPNVTKLAGHSPPGDVVFLGISQPGGMSSPGIPGNFGRKNDDPDRTPKS